MDMNIVTPPKKDLKIRPYSMDMKNHLMTLPKKGLKTRPYSMDMNKDIATLPKKGLKTRPYDIGMEKMDLKTRPYSIDMEKKGLKKLTKGQLIKLLMNQRKEPTPPPRTGKWESVKPKPVPCKHVNEDLILPSPEQFQDGYKPIPKPRTDIPFHIPKIEKLNRALNDHVNGPVNYYDIELSIPKPRTDRPIKIPKIKELNQALKGHAKSYEIELQDNLKPLNHFTKARPLTESHLEDLLKTMKGFKFIETLVVIFNKDVADSQGVKLETIYKMAFLNGKAKTITKPNDIEPELNMSRQEILNTIDKWVSEGLGWVIDRIDSHYMNVNQYKPLNGSSYIELPMELRNPKKGLINIKNKDDEYFRWCHIRHLNPQTEHPERIKKGDKKMIKKLNYDGIDFPLSQKHYNKVEKQNSVRINVFGYENGQPFPILISKETFED